MTGRAQTSDPEAGVLAADFGGTRLRAAAVLADGSVTARRELPTLPARGPGAVADDLAVLLAAVAEEADRRGIRVAPGAAVSATGPIDRSGSLVDPSNLDASFHGYALAEEVRMRLGRQVRVGLDTHLALLGEARFGALRDARDAIYVTVSTGVGGAILAGGRLVSGAEGVAGEIGHLPVMAGGPRCGCGARGHLEAVASGPAIAAAAEAAARAGRSAALAARMAASADGRLSGRDVAEVAAAGDAAAAAILARAREALGRAIVGVVDLLNPEAVVLGGGVILADTDAWVGVVRRAVARTALASHAARVAILPAALGGDAGLVGCRPFLLGEGAGAGD